MHYGHINIGIRKFRNLVMKKAAEYIKTRKAKSLQGDYVACPRHYGIDEQAPITIHHLLSIILYTDTTALSADFSASFRKLHPYETLSQIKRRNSKYWWWSKYLRETVEIYGPVHRY